jgi:hypothetical protein
VELLHMGYLIELADDVAEIIRECIEDLAPMIWREALCDFSSARITAANFAGYGRFSGLYLGGGVIAIPTGNSFSRAVIRRGALRLPAAPGAAEALRGLLLHELGHHCERTATMRPWEGLRAGRSTHTSASWCWVAATGWRHCWPSWTGTPESLAEAVRRDAGAGERSRIRQILRAWEPQIEPPEIEDEQQQRAAIACPQCGADLPAGRRSDSRFCAARCRIAAHRATRNGSAPSGETSRDSIPPCGALHGPNGPGASA